MTDLNIFSFLATTASYLRAVAPALPGQCPNRGKPVGYRPLKTRRAIIRQPAALASTRSKPGVLRSTAARRDAVDSPRPSSRPQRDLGHASLGALE